MAKLTLPSCVRPAPEPEPEPAEPISHEEGLRRMDAALAALKAGEGSREEALEAALKAADDLVAAPRAARASRR